MRRDPNLRVEAFPLSTVQRWLQAVVVHPGEILEALASSEAEREVRSSDLAALVKPSHSLTPEERVDIYHGMYLLRMEEALASDYPAARHFLGAQAFGELVRDYVQRYPSRSYTLNRLGDHLPQFFLDEPGRRHAPFLHDLTSAELAVSQAFDAEESPKLTAESLQAIPPQAWDSATLQPTAAFRLLRSRYAVLPHLESEKCGLPSPAPVRKASFLVVYRRDYSVYRMGLTRGEFALLDDLAGGVPLAMAVARAAARLKKTEGEKKVFAWFRTWVAEGMFSSVNYRPSQSKAATSA